MIKIRVFQVFSIVIIYFVATSELIYSSNYLELHHEKAMEKASDYFQVANKYTIALGGRSEIGAAAWEHFEKEYIPEIFKICGDSYFSIYQFEKLIRIPPVRTNLLDYVFRQESYETLPYYRIIGFTNLDYRYKLLNQSDQNLSVQLRIFGTSLTDKKSYNLIIVKVDMDYNYNVINIVRYTEAGKGLAVFGNGQHPLVLTCNYLKSNIGKAVDEYAATQTN